MGIRFSCPNGHKLNVKTFLAGKRGVCPECGAKFVIPLAEEVAVTAVAARPREADSSSLGTDSKSVLIDTLETDAPPILPAAPQPLPTAAPPALPPPADFAPIPAAKHRKPVSIYAVRRQRIRRLQMQTAVVLLVAVIVLALVLIWVLNRAPTAATEPTTRVHVPTRLGAATARAYVAEAITLRSSRHVAKWIASP